MLPIAANARIPATSAFVLIFICRPQTMKSGKMPRAQSAAALTADSAYVMPFVGPAEIHLVEAGWLFQNSETVVVSVAESAEVALS